MINLPLLPIIIPLFTGILLLFFPKNIKLQRTLSVIASLALISAAILLIKKVSSDGIQTVNLSNWEAPFGITLVSDMLSALLVLTTSIVAFACLIYSFKSIGKDRERFYYYPVFQFLLVGVIGAFSTGDIFNMFVFFEVMLMSSYVLLVIGSTKIQLRETIKYLLVNVISSALFVIAVGYLYSIVGTLNMAHISERISEIGPNGLITVIAILFMIVYGLKGAVFPLYVWLPGSYYAPPIPIMALFGALLTKVGVYSIMRTYSLFFYHDQSYTHIILIALALLTIIFGVIGAVAYSDVKKIIIYNIIIAIGVILFGFAVNTTSGIAGSIYYLIHDMIIKAALFLLIGIMIAITGTTDLKKMGGLIKKFPGVAWTYFLAALALAGIPPLSGFIGKILIVQGGFEATHYIGSALILLSSLFVLYSVMKIFIQGFWGTPKTYTGEEKMPIKTLLIAPVILVICSVFYGVGSEAVNPFIMKAAETLINPDTYIQAVLKE